MSDGAIKRIGILTGGGDCPGLNAVIRAVTKTALFDHAWECFGVEDGFLGLIEDRIHPLRRDDVSNILTRGGTILGTSNKANPARFAVGKNSAGDHIFEDVREKVMNHYRSHGLDALVVIGGDGTMTCAAEMSHMGMRCIGVPKTIDNDLMHTHITFGFATAVEIATEALDRLHTTAASHHRIIVVELMGRNAGWLALNAGLASGSDVILIPEIPYDLEKVNSYVRDRMKHHKAFTIIAVSEGAKSLHGEQFVSRTISDSPDPIRFGGIAEALRVQLETTLGIETRSVVLGHVQRGGTPCAYDRVLATRFGFEATKLLAKGEFNQMVVVQQGSMTSVPISDVAGKQRLIPRDHRLIQAARSVGTCFGD
ncbi:MAG TPA: ATP-dependent 6-phosphofructokinase [Phycisphaerae bacterium]|nr:ATP-dependent 6-phosphofructokinase [Phycisphaerae bacterium]